MKMNCWLLFGAMLSTSVLAQQVTNAPPGAPIVTPEAAAPAAAGTNAPAAKNHKSTPPKKAAKKKPAAAELRTVPLVPGPAVVEAHNVNVRGQAKLKSEIVSRLTNGQPVTVIEEITQNNSGPDEPSAWAKIALPPSAHVWVNTAYLDPTNKTVLPKKLNLRSGPAERFSVIGTLQRGDSVKEVGTKGAWSEIEAPANAFAFVAAQYLKQEPAGTLASAPAQPAATTTEPPTTPSTVNEPPPIAAPPTEPPATPTPAATEAVTNAATEVASTPTEPTTPPADEPPPKRVVQREGLVRGTFSIQAPTKFALISPDNGRTIDYLYTTSPNLDLRRYKGLRIIVTGEEGLEERWGNTPVITIQKIQVLE
jgi:uncharacterized protein YgiM (DUF1202 family)